MESTSPRFPGLVPGALVCLVTGCITDRWVPPVLADAASDVADARTPGDVPADATVRSCGAEPLVALASGLHRFTCVIRCDGGVWCWGANLKGALGDGTTEPRAIPAPVQGLDGPATALAAGYQHACAIVRGAVWCWGENTDGALGDGTRVDRTRPVRVMGLRTEVVALAGGGLHTCALRANGEVVCWGNNQRGGLGDGSNANATTPRVAVPLGGPARAIVAGQFHTCALRQSGEVYCWGQNTYGTLADGAYDDRYTAMEVPLPEAAVAVATQANHVCALLEGGGIWCWGHNIDGALGDGTRTTRPRPVEVQQLGGRAVALALGSRHTCAILEGGALRCWGANDRGQLGDGSTTRRLRPAAVALPGAVAQVGAGELATCAALVDGRTFCWGAREEGQLGAAYAEDQLAPALTALPR